MNKFISIHRYRTVHTLMYLCQKTSMVHCYIGLKYGSYLHFKYLKWPLINGKNNRNDNSMVWGTHLLENLQL